MLTNSHSSLGAPKGQNVGKLQLTLRGIVRICVAFEESKYPPTANSKFGNMCSVRPQILKEELSRVLLHYQKLSTNEKEDLSPKLNQTLTTTAAAKEGAKAVCTMTQKLNTMVS